MIGIQEINEAFKKMKEEEVRFRYVIDMISLKMINHDCHEILCVPTSGMK
jgi:hypothetical protein